LFQGFCRFRIVARGLPVSSYTLIIPAVHIVVHSLDYGAKLRWPPLVRHSIQRESEKRMRIIEM
jgi:hypothetical protein